MKGFAQGLRALVETNPQIVILDADTGDSTKIAKIARGHPTRAFNVGIAEQNLIGVAAGLAETGLVPFCNTFASFLTRRAFDQIAMSVALPRANVKLVGHHAGARSLARDGASHHALEDLALMRSLGTLTVLAPADQQQAARAAQVAVDVDGPVYIRLHRALPDESELDVDDFTVGAMPIARAGSDASLICTGEMLETALSLAARAEAEGIALEVRVALSIAPLGVDSLLASAAKTRRVLTLEEHRIGGGLGTAVAEVLSEALPTRLLRFGFNEVPTRSSLSDDVLMQRHGLDVESLWGLTHRFIEESQPTEVPA